MKILVGSDPHIYPSTAFSKPTEDGLTTHLHDIIETFQWFGTQVKKHKPGWVIITGDIFHTHDYIDALSLKVAHRVMTDLRKACEENDAKLVVLLGNHELFNAAQRIHLLHWLDTDIVDEMKGVAPYNGPVVFNYVPFMDHSPENEDRIRELSDMSMANQMLYFTHLEIVGATRQVGSVSSKGFPIDVFPPGATIINGHYHRPHTQHGPDNRVIHHVGSLTTRSFSDTEGGEPRGLLLIEADENGVQVDRIPGIHHKKFETVHIRQQQDLAKLELLRDRERTNVKVICHDKKLLGSKTLERSLAPFSGSVVAPGDAEQPDGSEVKLSLDTSVEANLDAYLADLDYETLSPLVNIATVKESLTAALEKIEAGSEKKSHPEVQFKRLTGRNFLSFKDFDIPLAGQGLVMVEGENLDDAGSSSNGSGKSALWEALFWVLYDKTLRGIRKTEVKWRNGKASKKTPCSVQLELSVGNMDVTIERYRDDPERGTGAAISAGDETISPRLAGDVQEQIEDLIGVDADMAQHLWLMTQGLTHRFMALGDADRKRLVESMLDLAVYDALHAEMRVHLRQAEDSLRSKQSAVEHIDAQIVRETGRSAEVEAKLKSYQDGVADRRRDAEETKASLDTNLKQWRLDIESSRGLVAGEQARVAELEKRRDDPEEQRQLTEVVGEIARLSTRVRTIKDSARDAQALLDGGKCPTCGQSLDNAEMLQERVEQGTGELEAELDTYKETQRQIEQRNMERGEEIVAAKDQLSAYQSDVDRLQGWINSGEGRLRDADAFLAGIERDEEAYRTEINLISDRIKEYSREREENVTLMQHAEIAVANMDFAVQLLSPTGIRSRVLQSAVEFLNGKLTEYSDILLGGERVVINNQTELKSGKTVDKFSVDVHGGRSYAACSSGERRRADLVIQFALNALARATTNLKTNLLVTDEIDDKLDVTGMENLVRLLKMIAEDGLSVFLVTQHSFLKGMIPTRWVVRKERGVSQMV